MSLEEEALKRKERLRAMRKPDPTNSGTHQESSDDQISRTDAVDESAAPDSSAEVMPQTTTNKPKFRSYIPTAVDLLENVVPKPAPVDVDMMVEDQLLAAHPETIPDNVELTNLAPRKPDWDLKRDVAKSLEKLERRTQRAIAELIRERMTANKDTEDLAEAVKWVSETQEKAGFVDEWEA